MNKSMLKIGYLMEADAVDMSIVSGPQLHVKAVICGLHKRGYHVRTVAIRQGRIQWTDDLNKWVPGDCGLSESALFHIMESPIRFIQARLKLPFFRLFDSYRFSDACLSALAGYDILYERDSTISYGGIIAARRLSIPIVLEVNGDLIEEWDHLGLEFSKTQRAAVHFVTRRIYRHVSHIVAVGETIRQRLIDRWDLDPSHISVVTNGADIDVFSNLAEKQNMRDYGIVDGEAPIIIFVGGFQPWHGIDLIIDAFVQLAQQKTDVKLVLVGDGPMKSEMQNRAQPLLQGHRIIFTGKLDHEEVAQLLGIADIAVIYPPAVAAEIVETPLKLFDYMAAGKAIIAPSVRNMKRILTDRVNALLVPPDNPAGLAKAMIELLDDGQLRKRLGLAARQDAIEKHSWDRAVGELETIFHRLVAKTEARATGPG
jgi:alpha-maltose-1-phosphate synthase